MRPLILIRFAWKNLWAHRMRALITVIAVTIGIASIIFLVSLGFGLERLVTSQVADFEAFRIIDVPSANLKTGKINAEAVDRISQLPHIISIDEIVDLAGRVRLQAQNSTAEAVIVAVQPSYFKLAEIGVEQGNLFEAGEEDQILVNYAAASLLGFDPAKRGAALGQVVLTDLIIPEDLRARDEIEGSIVKTELKFKVKGLTRENSNPMIYLPLKAAEANGVLNRSSLKVKLDDRKNVEATRQAIENLGFSTEYVGDTVAQISQVFSLFRVVLGAFGLIALAVAALGTFNILTISLLERIREVGLLKVLGMKRRDIFKLFMFESLAIGGLGGILGIIAGTAIGAVANAMLYLLAVRVGADPVAIYYTPPALFYFVIGSALVIGFLTGIYPAIRAINSNPLDVMRYE